MSSGSGTVYVVELSVAILLLFDASVATTVTLYVPGAPAAVIVPAHVSLATSVSTTLSAVTLAMPDSSVTLTVTLIDPFGATSVGSSTTE